MSAIPARPRSPLARFASLGAAVMLITFVGGTLGRARGAEDHRPKVASVADFTTCVDRDYDGDACLEALRAFVKGHPAQAFDAGRAVTMKLNHALAMPYFETALGGKGDAGRCKDDRLALAVKAALALPYASKDNSKDNPLAAAGRSVFAGKCFEELAPAVAKALDAPAGRAGLVENACPIFAQKKQVAAGCAKASAPPAPAPATAAVRWEALDPRQIDVEGSVKVYGGSEARRLTMAPVKGHPDYYLVKLEGVRGPWNGRVILHRERRASAGYDYFTSDGGAEYVTVTARNGGWGGGYSYEIFPKGDPASFSMSYDEAASKAASAKALLAALTSQR